MRLEKNRDLRYQRASEILTDLQLLKRKTDFRGQATSAKPATSSGIAGRRTAIAATIALALAAASYFYLHRAPKLTARDTIVLADFVNTTGDPVFDGALRQGLSVELEQSPFLSLVSDERIQNTLALMAQPPDAKLSASLARQICERTGSAAVLNGRIDKLGSQYVVGLLATNCRNGEVIDERQAQAARKEDVLNILSQIASKFRSRVGESLATVEKHSTPLAEATTSSLEALKAYSEAWKLHSSTATTSFSEVVLLLKRAVTIDPDFAIAHALLGRLYSDMGTARAFRGEHEESLAAGGSRQRC